MPRPWVKGYYGANQGVSSEATYHLGKKPNHPVIFPLSVGSLSRLPENPAYRLRSDFLRIIPPAGVFFLSARLFLNYSHLSFPSDRSKIAYIITLMSGRVHSWATEVWEQQSAICGHLAEFMAEVRKVFESPVSGRKSSRKLLDLVKTPIV